VAADYRDRHAHVSLRLTALRASFLDQLPAPSSETVIKILDLGSGPGRDSFFFDSLGYEVTALDPSTEMIRLVSQNLSTRSRVVVGLAQEMNFENEFDGIWASASLIHVPHEQMPETLKRIARALKPNGILASSLIYGVGTPDQGEIEAKGRYFNRISEDTYLAIANQIPAWTYLKELSHSHRDDYHGAGAPTADFGFFTAFYRKKTSPKD
jgi:SAM-dependent methyltransferase